MNCWLTAVTEELFVGWKEGLEIEKSWSKYGGDATTHEGSNGQNEEMNLIILRPSTDMIAKPLRHEIIFSNIPNTMKPIIFFHKSLCHFHDSTVYNNKTHLTINNLKQ